MAGGLFVLYPCEDANVPGVHFGCAVQVLYIKVDWRIVVRVFTSCGIPLQYDIGGQRAVMFDKDAADVWTHMNFKSRFHALMHTLVDARLVS